MWSTTIAQNWQKQLPEENGNDHKDTEKDSAAQHPVLSPKNDGDQISLTLWWSYDLHEIQVKQRHKNCWIKSNTEWGHSHLPKATGFKAVFKLFQSTFITKLIKAKSSAHPVSLNSTSSWTNTEWKCLPQQPNRLVKLTTTTTQIPAEAIVTPHSSHHSPVV